MALRALLSDEGLDGRGQRQTIAGRPCLHQRNKEITSGHLLRTRPIAFTAKRNTSTSSLESLAVEVAYCPFPSLTRLAHLLGA